MNQNMNEFCGVLPQIGYSVWEQAVQWFFNPTTPTNSNKTAVVCVMLEFYYFIGNTHYTQTFIWWHCCVNNNKQIIKCIAIDHDVEDAISMYQQYQPLLVPNSVGPVPQNNIVPSFTEGAHKRGRGRHRSKQNSLSIKLTPAYYDHETQTKLCKLFVSFSPSRSKPRSRSKNSENRYWQIRTG